jgi:hypothetical protein
MVTERRLPDGDHPGFWFLVGAGLGAGVTIVGGSLVWRVSLPNDSSGVVVPAVAILIGVSVAAVLFGQALAGGHLDHGTRAMILVVFLVLSQAFAWIHAWWLSRSCGGSGPQPGFCDAGATVPSLYVLHAGLGIGLGALCIAIGLLGAGRTQPER